MRIFNLAWLMLPVILLWAMPAVADSGDDYLLLGSFDIVVGDMGDSYDDWAVSPTRVYAQGLDQGVTRSFYFDSVPAALFVLREHFRNPDIVLFNVREYGFVAHPSSYVDSYGLIDGYSAYYVWDYSHYSRGGLPLVLAFSDLGDARDELAQRDGKVMDFSEVLSATYRWLDAQRGRIYWRGWHPSRWDNISWHGAWQMRWSGWGWHDHWGWMHDGFLPEPGHHGGPPPDGSPPPVRKVAPSFPPEEQAPPDVVIPRKPPAQQAPPKKEVPPKPPDKPVPPKDPPKPPDPPRQVAPSNPPEQQAPPEKAAPKDPPKQQNPPKQDPPKKAAPSKPPEQQTPPEKVIPKKPPEEKAPPKKEAPSKPPEKQVPPKKEAPKSPPKQQEPPKK